MSRSFQIPDTEDAAIEQVSVTVQLLTKKGWELAALIYALCEPGTNQHSKARAPGYWRTRLSFRELGRRLDGAKSDEWVRVHWHNWQYAIDHYGAIDAALGTKVNLPKEEYPGDPDAGKRTYLPRVAEPEKKVEAILSIIADDPEASALIEDAIVQMPEVAQRMETAFVQRAAHDPELERRIFKEKYGDMSRVEERILVAPPTPHVGTGFGATVYERVRICTPLLQEYLTSLERRQGRRHLDAEVQEELDHLDRAKALIDEYQTAIRAKRGVDYDATFNRLVGRQA